MRKIMIIAGLVALVVPSLGMAQPDSTPVVEGCLGSGGYTNGGEWRFSPTRVSDPTGSVGAETCAPALAADDARPLPGPPPTDDQIIWWLLLDVPGAAPVGLFTHIALNGIGDFACGNGTLTAAPRADGIATNRLIYAHGGFLFWSLDWTATFEDGVGELTGTATKLVGNNPTGETRSLEGTIVIEDGAAAGQCDDSAGAQDVGVRLVLQ